MSIRKHLSESSFTEAYWITPQGKVLDCGSRKHIDFICQDPRKFGITDRDIKQIYDKYGEPVGFEGKAREEVILQVIQSGFIRIRKYKDRWSINVVVWNRRISKLLSNWAYEMLQKPNKDRYMPINIDAGSGNPPKNIDMEGLSNLYESHKSLEMTRIDEMECLIDTEFQQLLDESYKKNPGSSQRRVDEAGIARIVSMLKKSNSVEFVIISAFRKDNSLKTNQSRSTQLLRDFRGLLGNSKGFGAYRLIGHWKECSVPIPNGKTVSDCDSLGGNLVDALEESWLILNDKDTSSEDFFNAACTIAAKYNQDGFISRTFDKKFGVYGSSGEEWDTFGYISVDNLTIGFAKLIGRQGYSEIKKVRNAGRILNIVMESLELGVHYPYYSNSERMVFHYSNLLQ